MHSVSTRRPTTRIPTPRSRILEVELSVNSSLTVGGSRGQDPACLASAAMRRTIVATGSVVASSQSVSAQGSRAGVAALCGGGAKRAGEVMHLWVCRGACPSRQFQNMGTSVVSRISSWSVNNWRWLPEGSVKLPWCPPLRQRDAEALGRRPQRRCIGCELCIERIRSPDY